MDLQATYSVKNGYMPGADRWDYDTFLQAAEVCAKNGHTLGIGNSQMASTK